MCFFFQAEDGIRDKLVTGVQTCALPIWEGGNEVVLIHTEVQRDRPHAFRERMCRYYWLLRLRRNKRVFPIVRSEERRVGKSVDLGGRRRIKKKREMNSNNV